MIQEVVLDVWDCLTEITGKSPTTIFMSGDIFAALKAETKRGFEINKDCIAVYRQGKYLDPGKLYGMKIKIISGRGMLYLGEYND